MYEELLNPLKGASLSYEIIIDQITEFEAKLDENHEVTLLLASFSKEILLHVTNISFINPDMMFFAGTINGKKAELIQHISQLNFLLMACEKPEMEKKARRIGFETT